MILMIQLDESFLKIQNYFSIVSMATTKISFSSMKIIKTRLQFKMEDEFLSGNIIIYNERKIANDFNFN